MTTSALLGIAITPYGVVTVAHSDPGGVRREPPDLPAHAEQPRRQAVVARWRRTEEGRLEARWLPTTSVAA
jgi:hypothetical protein